MKGVLEAVGNVLGHKIVSADTGIESWAKNKWLKNTRPEELNLAASENLYVQDKQKKKCISM